MNVIRIWLEKVTHLQAAKEANSPDRIVTQTGNNGLKSEELPFWVRNGHFL